MRTFAFWYAVFLVGSAVGATAGSSCGDGFAVLAGLLAGMALSGWIAERLYTNRFSALSKPSARPVEMAKEAQGLKRVRFASVSVGFISSETKSVEHDSLGAAFHLPKGMYEFAMQKQRERQTAFLQVAA
jgi:hypothetical protein